MNHTERFLKYIIEKSKTQHIHWPAGGDHITIKDGIIHIKSSDQLEYLIKCRISKDFIKEYCVMLFR